MGTPYFIDALRNEYSNDFYRTFANSKDGEAATLTYSFLTDVPANTPTTYGDPTKSFVALTDAQKTLVRQAMDNYEAVANIKFTATNGTADIRFGTFTMDGGVSGYADYPQHVISTGQLSHGPNFGEVWYSTALTSNDIYLAMHEIGHSLGLKHPFDVKDAADPHVLSAGEDNSDNTIMSYTHGPSGQQPLTPQLFDVIALQSIYGPALQRMTDDTYVFGADKLIWDGGGKDTITAAKAADDVTIDLNDGSWNYIGSKADLFTDDSKGVQVYLGDFPHIENLIGSTHDDHLTGNELANQITAGKGADTVDSGSGRDTIKGGAGADALTGGGGADAFIFTARGDSTVDVAGRDTIEDFKHRQHDKIDLSALDADRHTKGNQEFSFIKGADFSHTAGELRFSAEGGDTLVSGDTNGDGTADFAILIGGKIHLVEGDFAL